MLLFEWLRQQRTNWVVVDVHWYVLRKRLYLVCGGNVGLHRIHSVVSVDQDVLLWGTCSLHCWHVQHRRGSLLRCVRIKRYECKTNFWRLNRANLVHRGFLFGDSIQVVLREPTAMLPPPPAHPALALAPAPPARQRALATPATALLDLLTR